MNKKQETMSMKCAKINHDISSNNMIKTRGIE